MNRFARCVHVDAGRAPEVAATRPRSRTPRGWAQLLGTALLWSCGAQIGDGPTLGGETHFLVTCGDGCGPGLSCIDGACTRRCEPGYSSCSELASAAECVVEPKNDGEREPFGGTCDVLCAREADCEPLGTGYVCRSGACRAEPEARQLALSSGLSTRPRLVHAVGADTCRSGLRWVGGGSPSAEMLPGSDCMGCHQEASARPLLLGGTVYATGSPRQGEPLDDCFGLEGVEVSVVDAEGRELSTLTNRAGNFYFESRGFELAMPYSASIRWNRQGTELVTPMVTQPLYGGCARCHGASEADLPFLIPVDSADTVIPAGAIFTPGLYPD